MSGMIPTSYMEKTRYTSVVNVSKLAIEPFAPMYVVPSGMGDDRQQFYHVSPYVQDVETLGTIYALGQAGMMINGPTKIEPLKYGKGTDDWPAPCRITDADVSIRHLSALALHPNIVLRKPNEPANSLGRARYFRTNWNTAGYHNFWKSRRYGRTFGYGGAWGVVQPMVIVRYEGDGEEKDGIAFVKPLFQSDFEPRDNIFNLTETELSADAGTIPLRVGLSNSTVIQSENATLENGNIQFVRAGTYEIKVVASVTAPAPGFRAIHDHSNYTLKVETPDGDDKMFDQSWREYSFTASPPITTAKFISTTSGGNIELYGDALEFPVAFSGLLFVSYPPSYEGYYNGVPSNILSLELNYLRSGNYDVTINGDVAVRQISALSPLDSHEPEEQE